MEIILKKEQQLATLANAEHTPSAKFIFLISYGAGHAAALAPVARELVLAGHALVCVGLTTAPTVYRRFGIEAIGMKELAQYSEHYRDANRLGKRLSRENTHVLVDLAETEMYMGIGFYSQVRAFGLRAAREKYSVRGRQIFCPTEFFREIFLRLNPEIVVSTSAPRSERAALEAARSLDIKRLCLVDLYAPFEVEWCASKGYADKICVLNDAVSSHFQNHGVPRDKLFITGNPSFDRLSMVDKPALRKIFRKNKGFSDNARVVVWVSQEEPLRHPFADFTGNPKLPELIEDALVARFVGEPEVQIVVRFHPSEKREKRQLGSQVSYSETLESLDELLCGVDCVLTTGSTVALEAAILGTPVIQYTQSIFSSSLPLADMKLADAVGELGNIGQSVMDVFEGKNTPAVGVQALRDNVGGSAKRVADEIAEEFNRINN